MNEHPPTQQPMRCSRARCKTLLPATFFQLDYAMTRGRRNTCLACTAEENAKLAQRVMRIPAEKTCSKCGMQRPAANFYRHPVSRDGLKSHCNDCTAAYKRSHKKLLFTLPVREKRCDSCKVVKDAAQFYKAKHRSDKLQPSCKQCDKQRRQQVRQQRQLPQ